MLLLPALLPAMLQALGSVESTRLEPSNLSSLCSSLQQTVSWTSLPRSIVPTCPTCLPTHPLPGPLSKVYFSSQFAPLIIFFVMFLSVVKNTKLHHFVRFNCMQARPMRKVCITGPEWHGLEGAEAMVDMVFGFVSSCSCDGHCLHPPQAIMLDIAVMLFHILRAYLPAELK